MRRVLFLFVLLLTVLFLVACGGNKGEVNRTEDKVIHGGVKEEEDDQDALVDEVEDEVIETGLTEEEMSEIGFALTKRAYDVFLAEDEEELRQVIEDVFLEPEAHYNNFELMNVPYVSNQMNPLKTTVVQTSEKSFDYYVTVQFNTNRNFGMTYTGKEIFFLEIEKNEEGEYKAWRIHNFKNGDKQPLVENRRQELLQIGDDVVTKYFTIYGANSEEEFEQIVKETLLEPEEYVEALKEEAYAPNIYEGIGYVAYHNEILYPSILGDDFKYSAFIKGHTTNKETGDKETWMFFGTFDIVKVGEEYKISEWDYEGVYFFAEKQE